MARIRSIKPEFFTSEQVAECSTTARLLFVGMWVFSDDAGIHPASYKSLKMQIFPADSLSINDLKKCVQELKDQKLLTEYAIEDKVYWQITGWHHQKIEKPTFKYPTPNKSESARRTFDDSSTTARPRRGEERRGYREEKKEIPTDVGTKKTNGHRYIPLEDVTVEMIGAWAESYITAPINLGHQLERCKTHSFKKTPVDGIKTVKNWLLRAQEYWEKDNPTTAELPLEELTEQQKIDRYIHRSNQKR